MNLQKAAEDVLIRIKNDGSQASPKEKREAAILAIMRGLEKAGEISASEWGELKRLLGLKVSEFEKIEKEKINKPVFSQRELAEMISDSSLAQLREERREGGSSGGILHGLYPESSKDPEGHPPKIKMR